MGLIDDAEAFVAERMQCHALPNCRFESRLPDGRWLRSEDRRMPDGGRVVITRDITDEKRHAEEAARYTTLLRSKLENISQGLCASDGEQRSEEQKAELQ